MSCHTFLIACVSSTRTHIQTQQPSILVEQIYLQATSDDDDDENEDDGYDVNSDDGDNENEDDGNDVDGANDDVENGQ